MNTRNERQTPILLAGVLAVAASCLGDQTSPRAECPAVVDGGTVAAPTGVYRYASPVFTLRGTISFAPAEGAMVRVTDTTYDNAPRDRALTGTASLAGNRLDIALVPKNGDTDYTAQVAFVFSDEGRRFCVLGFSDTNGDTGGTGSFFGQRLAAGSN